MVMMMIMMMMVMMVMIMIANLEGTSFSKVPSLENSDSKSGDQSMLLLFVLKMCSMYLTHCNALKTKFKKAIS